MAVLILEGVNCTGKSTLAKLFAERTGLEIVKFGVPPAENAFGYFASGIMEAAARNESFIIDRCHLSNYAYGTRQGGTLLPVPYWQKLDQELCRLNGWLFLMTDNVFQIERRMKKRQKGDGADGWDRETIAAVQRRFEEAFEMTKLEPKGQFSLSLFLDAEGRPTSQCESILAQFQEACRA